MLFLSCIFILVIYLKAISIGVRDKYKHLLTDFFNLQFKREVINTSNFVNNPKLAELYNLKFNSYIVKFGVIRTFNYIKSEKNRKQLIIILVKFKILIKDFI
ncbi:hypothetical protein BUL45_14950 [Clostridium perfringens]|nr:hypothetical protein [Clostridium perfringens]